MQVQCSYLKEYPSDILKLSYKPTAEHRRRDPKSQVEVYTRVVQPNVCPFKAGTDCYDRPERVCNRLVRKSEYREFETQRGLHNKARLLGSPRIREGVGSGEALERDRAFADRGRLVVSWWSSKSH